jgi:HEAT repeat protein
MSVMPMAAISDKADCGRRISLLIIIWAAATWCFAAEDEKPFASGLTVSTALREQHLSEEMRKLEAEIGRLAEAGKGSLPRLLKFLRDVRVVSTTHHPGGRDQCGMPLVGYTTKKLVCDVAAAAIAQIYSKPGAKDADDETARTAVSDYFRDEILNDRAPDADAEGWGSKGFVIRSLGNAGCREALDPLLACLHHFMGKSRDWKWIPGREFIGATLGALAAVGDKRAATAVMHYLRNPGCDFLFTELTQCLSAVGPKAFPELLAAVKEGIAKRDFSYEQMQFINVLANIGNKDAVPLLRDFLEIRYENEWRERDFKSLAIAALARLNAEAEIDRIALEYPKARPETQYVIIESLKQLWKNDTKRILEYMVKGDGDHRTAVTSRLLVQLGGLGDYQALKGRIREGGAEYQAVAYSTIKAIAARLVAQETKQKTREAWNLWSQFGGAGTLKTPQAVLVLLHLLNNNPYQMHEKSLALQALGDIGAEYELPEEMVGRIAQQLQPENKFIRFAAAGALGRLGRKDGLPSVTEYLKNPPPDEVYIEAMAERAYAQITRTIHPRMTEKVLGDEQWHVIAILDLAEADPSLPVKALLESIVAKSANAEWRKRAQAVLPKVSTPKTGDLVKKPLPLLDPWAKERSELRVLVDALEEGVQDEKTCGILIGVFEFLDGQMQFAVLGRLAKYTGKPPQKLIAELIPPRAIASGLRSGAPQALLDLMTETLPSMPEGERRAAILAELRNVPGDAAKRLLEAMAASTK